MLLLLLGGVRTIAQPLSPDTPAGQAFRGWLKAFNSGNSVAYTAFVQRSWPSEAKDIKDDLFFSRTTGGFDLRKVEASSTQTKFSALIQERDSDQFAQLDLAVDAANPSRIVSFLMRPAPRPAGFALPHLPMPSLVVALRKKVESDAAADRFAGSVLVAMNGKPIFAQAYGLADRKHEVPNTLQTRFRIGSMNKMFTAVAILQLVQTGKLRLDDPLGKYLTDYPNKELAANVTIRELLTHTGGTGDIFGPAYDANRLKLRALDDYVNLYGKRAPRFKPGSRFEYSNYGFVLLGVVVEKASRENYYDYVREHVYDPAGMTSTGSEPEIRARCPTVDPQRAAVIQPWGIF